MKNATLLRLQELPYRIKWGIAGIFVPFICLGVSLFFKNSILTIGAFPFFAWFYLYGDYGPGEFFSSILILFLGLMIWFSAGYIVGGIIDALRRK